ncbi:MAG: hypothetical protein CVU59_09240 [Deltaproteobacteria bacterium HGW-Deltaproteobacteria-17]|jgi:hypothetical protein|nr:MAG: hypothetical protein CVU59_09240 [Deltaproteobacteria bacterium HGW-Deltaproteobacteria-17]
MQHRISHSKSGRSIQVGGRARGIVLLIVGLVLLGVAVLVHAHFGSMRIKSNVSVSPETLRNIFAGVPAGIGGVLVILGLVSLVRGTGRSG